MTILKPPPTPTPRTGNYSQMGCIRTEIYVTKEITEKVKRLIVIGRRYLQYCNGQIDVDASNDKSLNQTGQRT